MKFVESKKDKLLEIAYKCSDIRISRGYTQKDVAIELDVPLYEINNFENGRKDSAYILSWYIKW